MQVAFPEQIRKAVTAMIVSRPPPVKHGTCELCGGHNLELRILVIQDFIGWACGKCIEQIGMCQPRRYVHTGEHTEPSE